MQSHFHAVGTFEEMDRLLKNLAGSALSLVIYNICKFKTSEGVQFDLLTLKKQNCIIVILHLMSLTNPSFQPVG